MGRFLLWKLWQYSVSSQYSAKLSNSHFEYRPIQKTESSIIDSGVARCLPAVNNLLVRGGRGCTKCCVSNTGWNSDYHPHLTTAERLWSGKTLTTSCECFYTYLLICFLKSIRSYCECWYIFYWKQNKYKERMNERKNWPDHNMVLSYCVLRDIHYVHSRYYISYQHHTNLPGMHW